MAPGQPAPSRARSGNATRARENKASMSGLLLLPVLLLLPRPVQVLPPLLLLLPIPFRLPPPPILTLGNSGHYYHCHDIGDM